MADSPYRPVPPDRWPGLYSLGRRIDATAETVAGVGTTALLLASRGLLWADAARIGELPDEWDQE